MNFLQVIILVIVVLVLFFLTTPYFKKNIDSSVAKGLQVNIPKDKRPYFGIHYFDSGWNVAKQSPRNFIGFVILSPVIFASWLLWKLFGRELPEDFEKTFPPRHPGGRPSGSGNYDADEKAKEMILRDGLGFEEVFEKLRDEYYSPEQWENLNDEYEKEKAFGVWKRRIKRTLTQ